MVLDFNFSALGCNVCLILWASSNIIFFLNYRSTLSILYCLTEANRCFLAFLTFSLDMSLSKPHFSLSIGSTHTTIIIMCIWMDFVDSSQLRVLTTKFAFHIWYWSSKSQSIRIVIHRPWRISISFFSNMCFRFLQYEYTMNLMS